MALGGSEPTGAGLRRERHSLKPMSAKEYHISRYISALSEREHYVCSFCSKKEGEIDGAGQSAIAPAFDVSMFLGALRLACGVTMEACRRSCSGLRIN